MRAMEFPDGQWVNCCQPLTLKQLYGHVILFMFITDDCGYSDEISAIRELEQKYLAEPFIIIGVHVGKLGRANSVEHVRAAILRQGIHYPVFIDECQQLGMHYQIQKCPAYRLIGADGHTCECMQDDGKVELLDQLVQAEIAKARHAGISTTERINIASESAAASSQLLFPSKLAVNPLSSTLFVSDSGHHRILELQMFTERAARVVSIIGCGFPGFSDGGYQQASFLYPRGLYIQGRVLYVADSGNCLLRRIDLDCRQVDTIAGKAPKGKKTTCSEQLSVHLPLPVDVTMAGQNLYIAMAGDHQLWRLDFAQNLIYAVAGNGRKGLMDGNAANAQLAQPNALAANGEALFWLDSEASALRMLEFKTHQVNTLIGLAGIGYVDGRFSSAKLQCPLGMDVYGNNIYIADTYNHAIRVVDLNSMEVSSVIYRPNKNVCMIGCERCNVTPLDEPNDIKFLNGCLFITDTNHHQIRLFDLQKGKLIDLEIIGLHDLNANRRNTLPWLPPRTPSTDL